MASRPSSAKPPEPAGAARRKAALVPAALATESVAEHLRHVQRLVMQGELAATAVHEISNLLTIVLFNAGLLRERHKHDPREAKYIEAILHAATLTTTLCSQMRNLSRPTVAQSRVIDLAEAARGTFRLLEQIITRKLVFLAPSDGHLNICADPAQIDQMLVNLVLNARDATPDDGGRIVVRVRRGPRKTCLLEVEDNGTGITPEVKRQLFKTFFTTKPPGQGTGLGLVTVQRLMRGMGGDIILTGKPGQGTCVTLSFPSTRRMARPPASNAEPNLPV